MAVDIDRTVSITAKKHKKAVVSRETLIWTIAIMLSMTVFTLGIMDLLIDGTEPFELETTDILGETTTIEMKSDFLENSTGGLFASKEETFIPLLDFNDFFTFSLILIMGIPAFLLYFVDARRRDAIDKNLPHLLREVANAQKTGMPLPRAFTEAAKRNFGPLTPELKKVAAKLTWGIPFGEAMASFKVAVDTPLVRRAVVLILEAERSGGELEGIFDAARGHIQELLNIKEDREGQIKPYVYIIYAAFVIMNLVVAILFSTFFFQFADPSKTSESFKVDIDIPLYKILFLHMILVEGLLSGIIAGKMSSGKAANGTTHSAIMLTIGWVIFKFTIGIR